MRRQLIAIITLSIFLNPLPADATKRPRQTAPKSRTSQKTQDPALKQLIEGNNTFAFSLYGKLKAPPDNVFFSPYSISTALAMTYAGARGNTAKQMADTLHFKLCPDSLHEAFGKLQRRFNTQGQKKNYELTVANTLWGQQGFGFLEKFLNLTRTHYDAALNEVDFIRQTEKARQTINAWIEKKTNQKIKDLIKPGILNQLTRLVLTNAVYFKGNWASPFKKKATRQMPFKVSPDEQIKIPMMHQEGDFKYGEDEQLQILELPYAGNDLSMIVLLPKKTDGLGQLEKQLTTQNLRKWLEGAWQRKVNVYLPKFTLTSQFRLAQTLSTLGMPDAFSQQRADFSGMNARKDLFLSAVVHKAFVNVDEKGTEAAAATGAVIGLTALPTPPPVFRADHPFVFLIRDNQSGSILFLGRLIRPKP